MHTLPVGGGKVSLLSKCQDNAEQKQNTLQDVAREAMKCMSKQETPIFDIHPRTAKVFKIRQNKTHSRTNKCHLPRAEFKRCTHKEKVPI